MEQPCSPHFCAQRLKAIADPSRFTILKLLLEGPKYVWELNEELPLGQSLLSHHLKILQQEGLVESQQEGKAVLYCLGLVLATDAVGKYATGRITQMRQTLKRLLLRCLSDL